VTSGRARDWPARLHRGLALAARLPLSQWAIRTGRPLAPPRAVTFLVGSQWTAGRTDDASDRDVPRLRFSDFRRVVDELWTLGARELTLTGGEPTMIDGFPEWIAYAVDQGWQVGWTTSGRALSGRLLARLAAAGAARIGVSIDGCERSHDAVHGVGSFRDTMAGLDALAAVIDPARTQVRIDLLLMRHNVDDVLTVHAEAVRRRLWLQVVPLTEASPAQRAPTAPDVGWALDDAATDRLAAVLPAWLAARARDGWWLNSRRHLEELVIFARTGQAVGRCLVGAEQLTVDARLRVGFCTDAIGVIGDLTRESAHELWTGAAAAAARRKVAGCRACVLGCFDTPTLWDAAGESLAARR